MSMENTWQGLIAKIAVVVTVLTLISLALDLPEKIKTSYQSLTKSAPPILIKALFANQESFLSLQFLTVRIKDIVQLFGQAYLKFTMSVIKI